MHVNELAPLRERHQQTYKVTYSLTYGIDTQQRQI